MTPIERISEMMPHGAAIQVWPPEGPPQIFLLAALAFEKPGVARWCVVFPNDQHHIHETSYDTMKLQAGGRDVGLYDADGLMVGYISPFEESGLDEGESKDALALWRDSLTHDDNQKTFDQFFAHA